MDLPLQLNASAGHKANLTCSASGIPRPVITWFKDGSQVPPSLIREFKGYSMLPFHSVSLRNQGRYWCEASNSEGLNRSSPVNLTGTSRLQSNFFSQLINLCFPVVVCRLFGFFFRCCYYLDKLRLGLLLSRTVLQLLYQLKKLMIKITRQAIRGWNTGLSSDWWLQIYCYSVSTEIQCGPAGEIHSNLIDIKFQTCHKSSVISIETSWWIINAPQRY